MSNTLIVSCNAEAVENDSDVFLPSQAQLELWAQTAVKAAVKTAALAADHEGELELSVAYVDADAIQQLNKQYRDKDKPTNVLSFTAEADLIDPTQETALLLGDVVLCPKIIQDEALTQGKPVEHHFAHLVVHGVLHLAGLDHMDENEAQAMEQAEIQILSLLDIPDPYNTMFTQSK